MREQLTALRTEMQASGIDAWIVPTTDFHGSEYVNDYFKCREFLSGFTGSAGTLAVTQDAAALWTDGRYFLQAQAQLAGSGITLMKEGISGVPTLTEWLKIHLPKEGNAPKNQEIKTETMRTVGFDGRVVDLKCGRALAENFPLCWNLDLSSRVWQQRPPLIASELYALPEDVTGESAASKLIRIRRAMREQGADYHLITSLEEIAWIWNLRASDVAHTPVFYAFMLLTPQKTSVYLFNASQDAAALFHRAMENSEELQILPYFQIYEDLKKLPQGRMLLDESRISYGMAASIADTVETIAGQDPAMQMKAVKNETEIAATRRAHVRDGAAMVRFLYRLKQRMAAQAAGGQDDHTGFPHENSKPLTEISAASYLEEERRREGAYDLSFDTIAGYGPHGAIVHYESTPETDVPLEARGFLLVDSGGQYDDGTTDITRTIALGPLTDKMKRCYTTVLKGHIALASAVFDESATGADLDRLAREPLLAQGLDYLHGTGHGIGHLLSVHEGPNTISPRGRNCRILPGMITSNEPGVYLEGEFGIRLENEILCREVEKGAAKQNRCRQFFFETITFCPFEREAILAEALTDAERRWVDNYHRSVYETLAPLLEEEVRTWLAEQTAPLLPISR